jgi:hypothetical protein
VAYRRASRRLRESALRRAAPVSASRRA